MVLDSGFCVLKAIVDLQKVGVYSAALIKKRKYWPKGVPGEAMQSHFDKEGYKSVTATRFRVCWMG